MRVLIAPDKFAGTLSAVQAAEAIAEGWARQAPGDQLDLAPMSDGGPGFVEVLHRVLGGTLVAATVPGPLGGELPAAILLRDTTAYVESAQACGLHLTGGRDPEAATTLGVGSLIDQALHAGAQRIVVGLGGSATTDGGAGLLAALGATADGPLGGGPAALGQVTDVDLSLARRRLQGIELIAATDVDNPLTGLFGAAKTYGPQKGIPEDRLPAVDAVLERWAGLVDRRLALEPGAGAAGGLGFALMALGGIRQPGVALVAEAIGLPERAGRADLVITGEGAFDFSSRAGKVPYGVAEIATSQLRPCVVLAGSVDVGAREMRALGVESAHSLVELVGEQRALAEPATSLSHLAQRIARSWSSGARHSRE